MAAALTWIYRQGRTNAAWLGQGVRFGIAVAFLTAIPWYLIYHVVAMFPLALALKQIVFETIATIIIGVVVAALNQS